MRRPEAETWVLAQLPESSRNAHAHAPLPLLYPATKKLPYAEKRSCVTLPGFSSCASMEIAVWGVGLKPVSMHWVPVPRMNAQGYEAPPAKRKNRA